MAYEKQNFEDGKVLKAEQLNKMDDQIEKNAILIVNIAEDGTTASHTPAEIYAHIQAGGVAVLHTDDGYICNMSHCDGSSACFIEFCDDYIHYNHTINEEGLHESTEMWHAAGIYVDNQIDNIEATFDKQIGDISTALDEIIAIQESLIGLIGFNFNGVEYTALAGMTWAEWCDSQYNTDNPVEIQEADSYATLQTTDVGDMVIDEDGVHQTPLSVIVNGMVYTSD